MLACIRQGQHVLHTAERGKEATAVTFFKWWETREIAGNLEEGSGNGKKTNLGNFQLAILTSVLNTA